MNPTELFKSGQLAAAVEAQRQEVRSHPGDQSRRLFLFELLAFQGDLEKARRQIDALEYNEPELAAARLNYRQLLDCEEQRRRVFREGTAPKFLAEPPPHVRLRLEAAGQLRLGQPQLAAELLQLANEQTPVLSGTLNGRPFQLLTDCDDLFGPVLEVMNRGEYYWVPLELLDSVTVNPPRFPRDLLWVPARLTARDGASGEVYLPALYPFSHEAADEPLCLGRLTDWQAAGDGPVRGIGARLFLLDDDSQSLLEWRELLLDHPEEESAATAPAEESPPS